MIVDVNGIEILSVELLYNRSTDDIALSLALNMPPHKVVSRSANGVVVDEHNLLFVAPSCALNIKPLRLQHHPTRHCHWDSHMS